MQAVNFLSKLNLTLSKQQERDRKIFRVVLIIFSIALLAFAITFGSSFYMQYKLKSVQAQIKDTKQKLDSERQIEADYLFFVNKLIIIRDLFDQRSNKQIALGYFSNLFGSHIRISGLTYNMDEDLLSLTVTSPHVFFLEEAFNTLEDPDVTKHFASVIKSNLIRDANGEYRFNLIIGFQEESELVSIDREYEEGDGPGQDFESDLEIRYQE